MSLTGAGGLGRGGHRRGLVLAAVAVALLILVVAVMVHMRLSASGDAPVVQPTGGEGAADRPAPAEGAAPPAEADVLAGDRIDWVRRCGVDLPESQRYGPHGVAGDRRYGFSRDAGGAVVAAAHLLVQVSPQVGPDVFMPTLADQATGPDAQALVDAVHTEYEQTVETTGVPYGQPVCPIYAQIVGYLVDSQTPQAASLRLLARGAGPDGTPQLVALLVQLSWDDGDWRLVAPPAGDWSRTSTVLAPSVAEQYTPLLPGE